MQQQLADKDKKLGDAEQAQLALLKQKRELDEQKAAFELEKAKQIEAERGKIREDAKKAALATTTAELKELREQLATKDRRLGQAQAAELKL